MSDNLFPMFDNYETCWLPMFVQRIREQPAGDILEFGTGSGISAISMARYNPERRVITFDHFQGLEQTRKNIPENSGWEKGAFRLGHPDLITWPRSIDQLKELIRYDENIHLHIEDIHKLKEPKDYNIGKIVAVNIDVDIYEPCVSALRFIDKCEWDRLIMRFDDWHGAEPEYDQHERLAC